MKLLLLLLFVVVIINIMCVVVLIDYKKIIINLRKKEMIHEILSLSFKHVEHENVCKVTPMDPPANSP